MAATFLDIVTAYRGDSVVTSTSVCNIYKRTKPIIDFLLFYVKVISIMSAPNLLAFVGMPGSGKSTCVEHLTDQGYPSVYFGGLVVGEVKARSLDVTEANERLVREEFRAVHGMAALAVMAEAPINTMLDNYGAGIIDGLYGWSELKFLRERYMGLSVVALVAGKSTRVQRLSTRPIRPLTPLEVETRDISEIENLEKGGPIAFADHYIDNSGTDTPDNAILKNNVDELLVKLNFPAPSNK